MKRRVERVRVGLIAGSVLLLVVLAGMFGYARYRAGKAWLNRLKERSGASLVRETDGFTYSQSLKGKTVFTLHAAKAFQHKDGHWVLHDVVVTLYGQHDDRVDRVYGSEFEWDENQGIARAVGEVQMDLQVPAGIAASNARSGPATVKGDSPESVHVRTSGLVFVRQFGVAATHEQVEFRYGGLTCLSKGAEFDNSPSALHLLGDVRVNDVMRGEPVALTAVKADLDRVMNTASFVQPVLTSKGRTAHAQSALLHLRKDGSVERAEAMGDVALDAETRHVKAQRLDATLSEKNQPETARLSGGVHVADEDARRPAQGEAAEMRLRFDGEGRPAELTAVNGAHGVARELASNGVWLQREMRGDEIVAGFRADGKGRAELERVHAAGSAALRGDSVAKAGGASAGLKSTSISGDDLVMSFVAGGAKGVRLDRMHGLGHTVLRQTAALGEERVSSGDALDAVFGAEAGATSVASATQVGHVVITNRAALKPGAKKAQDVSTASAERGAYDGGSEKLSLTGGVHLVDGGTSLAADAVVVDQKTGDAEAHGSVTATLAGAGQNATHVSAQQAVLHKATQVAEFEGGAGKPARLWQEASQVEAVTIVVDRAKSTLVARPAAGGVVRSVFAGESAKAGGAAESLKPGSSVLRVESRLLEYSDALHQAVFSGPVRIDGGPGEVRGQRTVVTFAPGAKGSAGGGLMSGAVDRVVVSGDVKLEEPGRRGMGEQLVYKAGDGSIVLTGTPGAPPRIVDAVQGTVTGNSLLFRAGDGGGKDSTGRDSTGRDSTIVVAGTSAGEQRPQRAHIETHVRQKAQQ